MALVPDGPAAQIDAITETATTLNELLGDRIKDVKVVLKSDEIMPERSDGGVSYGFWKAAKREVWLWDETDDYPVGKTLVHEAMHVLDDDWLTRAQRLEIIALMNPAPSTWKDQVIAGVVKKYVALPYEVFAVYASAAVFGFQKPAYRRLYRRAIAPDKWPKLKEITLADMGAGDRGTDPVVQIASPPDGAEDLVAQLTAAQTQLAEAVAAREAAERKLSRVKEKIAEIGQL